MMKHTDLTLRMMWPHHCPEEGWIAVGEGELCNWCGQAPPDTPRASQSAPSTDAPQGLPP